MKSHRVPVKRKICWPDPDLTCLEGGCLYCNDGPWRSLSTIRRYAEANPVLENRGDGMKGSAVNAHQLGVDNNWYERVDYK